MQLVAKTLYGLEKVLAAELMSLGAENVSLANRAVLFRGNRYLLYKANYCLRTAMAVLMPVTEFRINAPDDLYKKGLQISWDDYMHIEQSFSIVPVVNSPLFRHTGFAGLLLKDSIADFFRNKSGRRPSVDPKNPDITINLHISNDQVTISLDSSGPPLFKRGYRKQPFEAPINEVLAAGIIKISGWDEKMTLYDPMCGSGTIPIEAAMIALNLPPGQTRKEWGFQNWIDYDDDLLNKVKRECQSNIRKSKIKISGSDISFDAVKISEQNSVSAGVSEIVYFSQMDFQKARADDDNGIIIMNPPYGKRISTSDDHGLYSMIGSSLKHNFPGFTAWIITSDKSMLGEISLKPSLKTTLFNGSIECTLAKYELYHGSKKGR